MSIWITVEFNVQDGRGKEFEAYFGRCERRVKAEDAGCEMYDLYKSVDSDTHYALLESWTTLTELEVHTEAYHKWASGEGNGEGMGQFMVEPPVSHSHEE